MGGGSSTVYGILFQILGSLSWVARLTLRGGKRRGRLSKAQLVLEPCDGGDLQIAGGRQRIVEQWKSRRTTRPWTIRDIIQDVLPDLFKAVRASEPDTSIFRFVTEGKCSDWSAARALFQWMNQSELPNDPIAKLDEAQRGRYYGARSKELTAREFFESIVVAFKRRKVVHETDDYVDVCQRTWKLLSRFEVKDQVPLASLKEDVETLVRNMHDGYQEDIPEKREQLCGLVLELSTKTGTTLSADQFLARAGLSLTALSNWQEVFRGLTEPSEGILANLLRYQRSSDVRSTFTWPDGKPILVITGASGQGKSWRLAAIGNAALGEGNAVAVVRATGTAKETLQRASDFVWKQGFRRQRPLELDSVACNLRECAEDLPPEWLTLVIDEASDIRETRELLEYPWAAHGIRAAIAVSQHVRSQLKDELAIRARVEQVEDFTPLQLREFLKRRGRKWEELPHDMKHILLRPLLAELYCRASHEPSWKPTNEYELFSAVWEQANRHPRTMPDDMANLRELVQATTAGKQSYPWDRRTCREFGLDQEAIQRLVDVGWLERSDRIRVWHSRLLDWAVAEGLVDDLHRNGDSALERVKCVAQADHFAPGPFGMEALNYVPMDLMWLVCHPDNGVLDLAHKVLATLEETAFNDYSKRTTLYSGLVPTLGMRVVPVVIRHVRNKSPTVCGTYPHHLANALLKIAKQSNTTVADHAAAMLSDESLGMRLAGSRVLCVHPTAKALDDLLRLLTETRELQSSAPSEKSNALWNLERCARSAFHRCASLDVDWLEPQLTNQNDPKTLSELAGVLARCEGDRTDAVWASTKDRLFEEFPNGDANLVLCIDRFQEASKVGLLEAWCQSEDAGIRGNSFEALAAIAPERAITAIIAATPKELGWHPMYWLPVLLSSHRQQMIDQLGQAMASSHDAAVTIGLLPDDCVPLLDSEWAATLMTVLESCIQSWSRSDETNERKLHQLLQVLSTIRSPHLLDQLRTSAGSSLERSLVSVTSRWLQEYYSYQFQIENAIEVLLRIGGRGFTSTVNHMLASTHKPVRRDGLELALVQPDGTTRRTIRDIALTHEVDDGKIPDVVVLRDKSEKVLAQLGEDASLVEVSLFREIDVFSRSGRRRSHGPMKDEVIRPAVEALQSSDDELRRHACLTIGLSGRLDLIPRLHEVIQKSESGTRVVLGALFGLAGLSANDEESIRMYADHLRIDDDHRFVAANGLLRADTPEARQRLLQELHGFSAYNPLSLDERILFALARFPDTREAAVRILRVSILVANDFSGMFRSPEYLELFGECADEDTEEALRHEADPPEIGTHVNGHRAAAIRGLAKRDSEAAFDSASRALVDAKHERSAYADILVEIDSKKAVPILCKQFKIEKNRLVRRAIGLALRTAEHNAQVLKFAESWLLSGDADDRCRAAQLARWMGPPFLEASLRSAVGDERIAYSRWSICHTLVEFQRQKDAAELLERLQSADGIDAWCYLDALFTSVDPAFLGRRNDPLWIGPSLDNFPDYLRRRTNDLYGKWLKKTVDDAKFPEEDD